MIFAGLVILTSKQTLKYSAVLSKCINHISMNVFSLPDNDNYLGGMKRDETA